jgi:hypothetical protein
LGRDIAELADRFKGKNIEKVLPITVRHRLRPLFLLSRLADGFYEKRQIGNGSTGMVLVKPSKGANRMELVSKLKKKQSNINTNR